MVVVAEGPRPPVAPSALARWLALATPDEALAGVAALAAAVCIGLLVVAAALVLLSGLPGVSGVVARRLTACVVPWTVRRTLEAVLGVSIAAAPVVAPIAGPWVAPALADEARPAPTWSPPLLDRPTVVAPQPATARRPVRPASYVVRAGDCLWTIAAAHLAEHSSPAAVAVGWPRWYAASRRVIGPDPNLLRPRQRLIVPTDAEEISS
jgi:nucleoid-associated protein YgaU